MVRPILTESCGSCCGLVLPDVLLLSRWFLYSLTRVMLGRPSVWDGGGGDWQCGARSPPILDHFSAFSLDISLPFHCLSLTFHVVSLPFLNLSQSFLDFHSSTFHCPSLSSPRPISMNHPGGEPVPRMCVCVCLLRACLCCRCSSMGAAFIAAGPTTPTLRGWYCVSGLLVLFSSQLDCVGRLRSNQSLRCRRRRVEL